jgi:hypothetical protein
MTPKEKAEELVDKFILNVLDYDGSGLNGFKAKQCALICVDEVINQYYEHTDNVNQHNFWQDVKDELNKKDK